MKKLIVLSAFTLLTILCGCSSRVDAKNAVSSKEHEDAAWKIGGKIHFEEHDGSDYLGLISINRRTREAMREIFHIEKKDDVCADNAKALLKRKPEGTFIIFHREELQNPGVGEEMHVTLLYTRKRMAMGHETLKDIYPYLQEIDGGLPRDRAPSVQQIAQAYQEIIKPDWRFVIANVVLFKEATGGGVISAQLLRNGKEEILNQNGHPISGNFLHLTLASLHPSALSTVEDEAAIDRVVLILKEALRGKFVKIADVNGQADIELGISGSTPKERVRPKNTMK